MANRFIHAISEGDGISIVAVVADANAAREAAAQRAEALLVDGDPAGLRDASELPILCGPGVTLAAAAGAADAYVVVFEPLDDDDGRLEELIARVAELGLDCVVDVRNEDELEQALERVDPEVFLISPREEEELTPLECVLALLPDVPAGKLAIADLPQATRADVVELERAGFDAVIASAPAIAELVGGPPPVV
jgi:indole-3-glycerol phosphate synthase